MDSSKAIEIKVALLRCGIKQADIARALGVKNISVSDVIHGKRTSRRITAYIENVIKCSASNCPAEQLSAGQLCGTIKTLGDKRKNIMVKVG